MRARPGTLGARRVSSLPRPCEEAPGRFGILLPNQRPPGASMVERFADTIEQVRLARDLGFDVLVFGQHFLLNEYQAPQPAVAAARLAAAAGAMRVARHNLLLAVPDLA